MTQTFIRMDHKLQLLHLTHVTGLGFQGHLYIPFDPGNPYAQETIYDQDRNLVYETEFFRSELGDHTTDLEPYLIGMTRSAERRALAHAV